MPVLVADEMRPLGHCPFLPGATTADCDSPPGKLKRLVFGAAVNVNASAKTGGALMSKASPNVPSILTMQVNDPVFMEFLLIDDGPKLFDRTGIGTCLVRFVSETSQRI